MVKLNKVLRSKRGQEVIQLLQNDGYEFKIEDRDQRVLFRSGSHLPLSMKKDIEVDGEFYGTIHASERIRLIGEIIRVLIHFEKDRLEIINETLDRYKEISLIYKFSDKLIAQFDTNSIAELVFNETLSYLRGDAATLMLHNEESGKLQVVAFRKDAELGEHIELKPGEGIGGSVFESGQAEIVNDVAADPRFVEGNTNMHSMMCAPLKVKGNTIGVINLTSSKDIQYTSGELKVFNAIASLAAYALENSLLHTEKVREERIKSNLERYVPSQLVEAIINSENDSYFEPRYHNITTLFSDIRSFTRKCEDLPAKQIVDYLNEYFSEMVEVIFEHKGTINKLVGDMIVALFGAPYDIGHDARFAVEAAIKMQERLALLDNHWIRENFLTGIGINKGEVIVGNIGSSHHMDYTAIGDAVNVASRLQSLAKGGQILVTDSIYEETAGDFKYRRFDQSIQLKGRMKPVQIFEVVRN